MGFSKGISGAFGSLTEYSFFRIAALVEEVIYFCFDLFPKNNFCPAVQMQLEIKILNEKPKKKIVVFRREITVGVLKSYLPTTQ